MKDSKIDPCIGNNLAIQKAFENGQLDVIILFHRDPRVDPSVEKHYTIRKAAENDHLSIIEHLRQDSRFKASDVITPLG